MSGIILTGIGIALIAVSVVLSVVSVIYRNTAGRRIRKELNREYRQADGDIGS